VSEQGLEGIAGTAQNGDQLLDAILALEDSFEDGVPEEQDATEDDLIDAEAS
jgi:hypothetical protein